MRRPMSQNACLRGNCVTLWSKHFRILWGHFCNFGTPLYLGSRRIPNAAIPDVVIPNEVVGWYDGVSTQKLPTPY